MAKQCKKCECTHAIYEKNSFTCNAATNRFISNYTWESTGLTEEEIKEIIYNDDLDCPIVIELTESNFIEQMKKLENNQYFIVGDEDKNSFIIGRINKIVDMYIIGNWGLTDYLKIFPAPKSLNFNEDNNIDLFYENIFEYAKANYFEPDMKIISEINYFNK